MATTGADALTATRRALHVIAEHVLLADLYDHTGRIGLHQIAGGFGTPPYPHAAGATRRLRVEGTDVVDERDGHVVARIPVTVPVTLDGLRQALAVTAAPPSDVYDLGSDGWPGRQLVLDPASTDLIATFLAMAHDALVVLGAEARVEPSRTSDDGIGTIHLWPEHLDLARSIDEITYGASPGDDAHPEPYLYVAPWSPPRDGVPWNESFGASLRARPVPSVTDTLAWWRRIRAAAQM